MCHQEVRVTPASPLGLQCGLRDGTPSCLVSNPRFWVKQNTIPAQVVTAGRVEHSVSTCPAGAAQFGQPPVGAFPLPSTPRQPVWCRTMNP